MYQLTVSTQRELERATLRAQAQKPRISETDLGIYKVWSSGPSNTDPYLVGIEALQDGGYEVCCSCPTQRYLCKHVAACFPHYIMRLKEQTEPVAATQAAPALIVGGFITTSIQEIEALIEQAKEESDDYTEAQAAHDRSDLFG